MKLLPSEHHLVNLISLIYHILIQLEVIIFFKWRQHHVVTSENGIRIHQHPLLIAWAEISWACLFFRVRLFKDASVSNGKFLYILLLCLLVIQRIYLSVDVAHIFIYDDRRGSTFWQVCWQNRILLLVLLSVLDHFLIVKDRKGEVKGRTVVLLALLKWGPLQIVLIGLVEIVNKNVFRVIFEPIRPSLEAFRCCCPTITFSVWAYCELSPLMLQPHLILSDSRDRVFSCHISVHVLPPYCLFRGFISENVDRSTWTQLDENAYTQVLCCEVCSWPRQLYSLPTSQYC